MKINVLLPRFPFDWKSPMGFLLSTIITCALVQFGFTFMAHLISLGIGMNFFVVSFTEDAKQDFCAMNLRHGTVERVNIYQQISEFVQIHSDAKQLRFI